MAIEALCKAPVNKFLVLALIKYLIIIIVIIIIYTHRRKKRKKRGNREIIKEIEVIEKKRMANRGRNARQRRKSEEMK